MTAEQWEHFATDAFSGFDMDRTMPAHLGDEPDAAL